MNRYSNHEVFERPGTFARCKHGYTSLSSQPCWKCGLAHPLKFAAHVWAYWRD